MVRRGFPQIVKEVYELLKKEKELSVRQISIRLHAQWKTVNKALELLKYLDLVEEHENPATEREDRLFRLR